MLPRKIRQFMRRRCCTLLGVGPMSRNCVDAAIELSNLHDLPLFLVASRRQIDAEEFGGGYVNGWATGEFARYVRARDKKGLIVLARDHGGPWQSEREVAGRYTLRQAMESAKRSYKADIEAGFEFLHIDPSADIRGEPDIDEALARAFELYEHCWAAAKRKKKELFFEIGAEKQTGDIGALDEVRYMLAKMRTFCRKNRFRFPSFVVVQTGTKVAEMKNIGTVGTPYRIAHELPAEIQLPKLVDICNRNNIFLKQHNTDYLDDDTLCFYPKLGIHSANVAPEFGTRETLALLGLFDRFGLEGLKERFLGLALESGKWDKWMLPGTAAGDREKAVIAGHYVFSDPRFSEIKTELERKLKGKIPGVDEYLKEEIKKSLMRYLKNFRLLRLEHL
ncbi:MAG: class II D-tagatose-bisphosphate aldolase, non-catalytic subunit [Elusimicrobia bacterium]|nr:class II D-tagatose-bisphosphate aldolase, non-catalytic subunit [Elusimicrobiota bacterium]